MARYTAAVHRIDAAGRVLLRIMITILVVLLVLLQVQLWRQYAHVVELRERVAAQHDENRRLDERNAALAAEVEDLRTGLAAVEERARAELGLIRDGERFFLVVDPDELSPEALDALEAFRAAQRSAADTDANADTRTGTTTPIADAPPDG